jgi:putative membrane protein
VERSEAACFAAGWLALAVALLSPIDRLGGELFSVHMLQHELLMLVAAPLLVRARPHKALAWGLPARARPLLVGALRARPVRAAWRAATGLGCAWLLHAAALWVWHVPALFEASLRSDAAHALQHATFFASAVVWWASIAAAVAPGADRHAAALGSVFTTALHGGALGALLVFSDAAWIPVYQATAPAHGLTALEDQQIAGLVMWIPAGVLFAAVCAALVWSWLVEGARRARLQEARR